MLRNKNVTKVLSLLVAIVLWAYVIAFENPSTTQKIERIPVELINVGMLAQNGFAVLDGENATVDVVVSGTRADIAQYRDQITATANVFGYTNRVGDNRIPVEVVPPNNSLTIVEVRPARILVKIERLVSVYRPVNITFTGEAQPNAEPGNITIQPEQIEIKGPESLVESVSYVGVEVPYSQISRSGSALTLPASAFDADGEIVPNVKMSSDTVSVYITLYETKEVPLLVEIVGEISGKYEMTMLEVPETIKIRGSVSALAEIDSIEAEPIDISEVEVTSELPVEPNLPEGVEIARGSANIHVNIGIKGISNSSFEYNSPSTEIEIQGLSEGLNAYINTPALTLKATGSEVILSSAEKEDFKLSVDLQDLEQGTHVVPVIVTHDKVLNNLEIVPGEVHITISERGE